MLNWLKKHFIPHEGNNHRPHFLHGKNIRNVLILILIVEAFVFLTPTLSHFNRTGGMAAVLPAVLASLTNQERQTQNLTTLTSNPNLVRAAEMKAQDMATKGYFAHTSPEGKTPWYWLEQVGYKYQYAGENLAVNFNDSKDVTNAWMNSPTHRANIVKDKYTEFGTGIATGVYQGRQTVFVAQVYANPLPVEIKKTEPKVVAKKIDVVSNSVVKEETKPENKVLGAEVEVNEDARNVIEKDAPEPTFWQKAFASPRNTTNIIFFVIFGIVALSLVLYIFIKMKNHHFDLITNALIILVIIGAICLSNYYLSHRNMIITQSVDYSLENK